MSRVSTARQSQAKALPRGARGRSDATARALCSLLTVLLLFLMAGSATAKRDSKTCQSKPYVVKIHADWCGSCRLTESTWARIKDELADRATVVRFDVSDRKAFQQSLAEAERLGIADFFQEYRSRTGTIAVLDCKTLRPVAVLSGERDFDKYSEAVSKASRAS